MAIITHKNLNTYLDKLLAEPEFTIGSHAKPDPLAWYRQTVILEVPTGELCKDGLTTLALLGRQEPVTTAIVGDENFDAQGLEGKVCIHKDLFSALMNLRDLVPLHRGHILYTPVQ
jgi:hypothetical protein